MDSLREELIADLVKETGLTDTDARKFLNALTGRIIHDLNTHRMFAMPRVGNLALAASANEVEYSPNKEYITFDDSSQIDTKAIEKIIKSSRGLLGDTGKPTGIRPPLAEQFTGTGIRPPISLIGNIDLNLPKVKPGTRISVSKRTKLSKRSEI